MQLWLPGKQPATLHSDVAHALFDETNHVRRMYLANHRVAQWGNFHLKESPECPGLEYAFYCLANLLFGENSVTPAMGVVGMSMNGEKRIGTISETIASETGVPCPTLEGLRALSDNECETLLSGLNADQVSRLILLMCLCNPEDGKPDSIVIQGDALYTYVSLR